MSYKTKCAIRFVRPCVFSRFATAREIWLILDERERIDAIDEEEGQKVQDMVKSGTYCNSFGCELRVEILAAISPA